mgnify:CR=1 FL=1
MAVWQAQDISAYNTQSQFADVDSKMYYNAYVNWAAANKIVSGVDASHFNPNALITREQAAVIMDNYLTATGTKVEETGSAAALPTVQASALTRRTL